MIDELNVVTIARAFAESGFYVFPLIKSKFGFVKQPFGWSGTGTMDPANIDKIIAATDDLEYISNWPLLVKTKYGLSLSGFGILGKGVVVIDVDVKDGKPGIHNFNKMLELYSIPKPTMITITKSGGMHAYYRRSDELKDHYIKSLANVPIDNKVYEGVDLKGDAGYAVGPSKLIDNFNVWKQGTYATISFSKISELPLFPDRILKQWLKSPGLDDLDSLMTVPEVVGTDFRALIRRGEIPNHIPYGARNDSFFIFINVLKSKGVPVDVTRHMCSVMTERVEKPDDLSESVDVDAMINRIYTVDAESPYDVAVDLINKGLFQLTNYKSSLQYVIFENNPYVVSRVPHDETSMSTLLIKYQKISTLENGKKKVINPIDVVKRLIRDENRADTVGFKANAGQVFTLHHDSGARRFLNAFKEIPNPSDTDPRDDQVWDEFLFLINRLFGVEGSDEYEFILDFVAHLLQKPHIKPAVAPFVLSMNRGVGKSLFFNVLVQIFGVSKTGERQARLTKTDELSGRFFDPTGCMVNLLDEVQFPTHRDVKKESVAFWRHLKNLITAETISVEVKGGSTSQHPNGAAMMLAGNVGYSFPVEEFDRRLWIIDNNPEILSVGEGDKLFALVTGKNTEVDDRQKLVNSLRYHLYRRKIRLDLSSMRAPMNDIKQELLLNNLSNLEEWFLTYFNNKGNLLAYTPIISKSALAYVTNSLPDNVRRYDTTAEDVFRTLRKKGKIRAVRTPHKLSLSRQFLVTTVQSDGFAGQQEKGLLYTTREHGQFDRTETGVVQHLYQQNLQTIKESKDKFKAAFKQTKKILEGLGNE